jgi:foldase protein PrsA
MPVKKSKAQVKKAPVKKTAAVKSPAKSAKKAAPAKKTTVSKVSSIPKTPVPMTVDRASVMSMSGQANKIDAKKLFKPLLFLLILGLVYVLKDEVVVASVNGKPITRMALIRNLEQQSAATVLENLTLKMLVEQELKKAGVQVSDEEMDAEITKIEDQLAAQGQNLDDLLKAQGLSRSEVKEQLALSKGLEKLLADKVSVTEEEVTAYFEENKEFMGVMTLDEVRADIEAQLSQEKLTTEQQKWFAEIKQSANIKYYKFAPSANF